MEERLQLLDLILYSCFISTSLLFTVPSWTTIHYEKKIRLKIKILLLSITCMLFTSCFDLVEEIDMKADGSGSIKATLNLSKSKTKVASLMKMKSVNGLTIPSQATIKSETATIIKILQSTPGISRVNHTLDFTNFIATISCDFTSVTALNSFTKTLAQHFKSPLGNNHSYSYNNKSLTFGRQYTYASSMSKEFSKLSQNDRKLFDDAFYTQIVRFDKSVKSQNNPTAKLSATKKSRSLKNKSNRPN